MGLSSIAEGIETQEQLDLVMELGGKYVQGFLFDEALKPETIKERLTIKK